MTKSSQSRRRVRFLSIRWRYAFPLALVVLLVAMFGAYFIAGRMAGGVSASEENVLLQSAQAVGNRSVDLYQRQRNEAQRIAFTVGIADAVVAEDAAGLVTTLESLALGADVDSILLTNAGGIEVAGVLRVREGEVTDYSVSTATDLRDAYPVRALLGDNIIGASGLLQTPQGMMLYVSYPLNAQEERVGVVLVGQLLSNVLENLRASAVAHLALYDSRGQITQTTFPLDNTTLVDLSSNPTLMDQVLTAGQPVTASLMVNGTPYRTSYTPLEYGTSVLGVIATLVPDNVPFATEIGRQLTASFAAAVAGTVVIVAFLMLGRMAGRLERVTDAAHAMARGVPSVRTNLKPTDEIGAVGHALDHFAYAVQRREDQFRKSLWRERRERNYLLSVMESIPQGVLVQDTDGRVIFANDLARDLLGTQAVVQPPQSMRQLIHATLGEAIAPGIYALGDPQQIDHKGKMLQVQAAAVRSKDGRQIGTTLLMRDITTEVKEQRERDHLLDQLSADIQQPLASLAQRGAMQTNNQQMVGNFAREISRHAAALQKMIVDMRELTRYSQEAAQRRQRPILAETLVVAIANDWRQIAQAADLSLQVHINKKGMHVLGDESRLRWALGNLLDNAIKYTLPGGIVTIEVRDEVKGVLHLRVRDNGVGILPEDMEHIYTPFYRGTPVAPDGNIIRVPGMGQGLPLAKQIIEAHGGLMKVKTRHGIGTAVYVALPVTAGTGYQLPLLDENMMEGATVRIEEDFELRSF
jgi:signal transduction histidine kinase